MLILSQRELVAMRRSDRGWKIGNTFNGAQAEYLLIPHAQANLAKIPDELSDEQVVLLAD
jgi:alcohol dehydrogenase